MTSPHFPEDPLFVYVMDRLMYLDQEPSEDTSAHPVLVAENLVFYLRHKYGSIPDPTVLHFVTTHVKNPNNNHIRMKLSVALRGDGRKVEVLIKVVTDGHKKMLVQLSEKLNELITPLVN